MVKAELAKREPVIYRSLSNSLYSGKLAQAYLFCGPYDPFKQDVAYLLAQSLIENKGDWACENCSLCRRIKENNYYDFIYIDGYREIIKVEDIANLIQQLSLTGLESSGKKVYILANVNNATAKALNMLLKFMEEPASDNTYGILISDDKDSLLETIVSRCRCLTFKKGDLQAVIEAYCADGYSEEDGAFLAAYYQKYQPLADEECFTIAKEIFTESLKYLKEPEYLPILYGRDLVSEAGKDKLKDCLAYYFEMMLQALSKALIREDERFAGLDLTLIYEMFITAHLALKSNYANPLLVMEDLAAKLILRKREYLL